MPSESSPPPTPEHHPPPPTGPGQRSPDRGRHRHRHPGPQDHPGSRVQSATHRQPEQQPQDQRPRHRSRPDRSPPHPHHAQPRPQAITPAHRPGASRTTSGGCRVRPPPGPWAAHAPRRGRSTRVTTSTRADEKRWFRCDVKRGIGWRSFTELCGVVRRRREGSLSRPASTTTSQPPPHPPPIQPTSPHACPPGEPHTASRRGSRQIIP